MGLFCDKLKGNFFHKISLMIIIDATYTWQASRRGCTWGGEKMALLGGCNELALGARKIIIFSARRGAPAAARLRMIHDFFDPNNLPNLVCSQQILEMCKIIIISVAIVRINHKQNDQ